ncbi:DUF4430 domain-containing protein [Clostridium sp. MSJ-11]|uniref:DUF4430 domain-containing protein n=1 Tax=Clostridium mobile TaxID=2841512 RepID=A0ABS6EK85_9CLOT|nr:DUF4430 domain-containing protein [Clostridium mobile]MBU5485616.1 DUF4430 domain-containing protein [Clostridium mobile]
MNNKRKRIISFLMAFAMILSTLNLNLFNSNKVYAESIESVQATATVNEAIEAVIACMNKDYYDNKGGSLEGEAYAAMHKAGADIGKKDWRVNKDTSSYGLAAFGSKVTQALALMDLDEDPTIYKEISLISDIAKDINKVSSSRDMGINEVKALILLDRYSEKYSDKKVDYNLENAIKNLIEAQKKDGSINNAPQHTAAAIVVLNKHRDIEGVNDCINKALDYLHGKYTQNGALVNSKFFTGPNAEAVMWFVQTGENLTSEKWIKDGKGIIETLFNSWNGKKFVSSTGRSDYSPIPKVLSALVSLKEAGYGDYEIKGVKFDNINKEEPEKTCKANITIVYPNGDKKYDVKFKPSEVTISNKKQSGLTVLGALQATTDEYEAKGSMVTSIFGMKTEGMNGWMYSLNGEVPSTYANETEVKDGDKIVWYYSKDSMNGKGPSYEEVVNLVKDMDKEEKPEEPEKQKDGSSIASIINAIVNYYNEDHFITNQGQLQGFQYSAMYKAGADLGKKQWYLSEKYESFDKDLAYVGSKANQSLILIDLNRDANDYNNRKLIDEIVEKINSTNSYFGQREITAVIALDKYNEKFKDTKVDYNIEHAISKIIEAQCEDGGFKERGNSSVPINTGYALMALSKHKDVKGVDEAIEKALTYLQGIQKDDGGLYDTAFITGYHSEVLRGIIAAGENPTSKKWTKPSGKNPVDALFTLWKDNNSFDGKKGESINNRGWVEATWKALYALIDLRDAGYGEYVVDGVKVKGIDDGDNEQEEKTFKVNVAIAIPEGGKYECYFKPQEVTISDKKHDKGFTALGALQASTELYQMTGDMVTSIYGIENAGKNGWMYTVNEVVPEEMASKVSVKAGDKIIWYYSMGSMEGKAPTWEELTGKDSEEKPEDYTKEVEEAIKSSSAVILNGNIDDWNAIALKVAGIDVPDTYLKSIEEKIKNRDENLFNDNGKFSSTTDCERTIIGIVAAGGDPRNIGNYNLIEDLCSRDLLNESNIYSLIYGLIALDSGKFNLFNNSKFTREDIVKEIVDMQSNGGWGWGPVDGDTTSMCLIALSNYKNDENVKKAIDNGVKVLNDIRNDEGEYTSEWNKNESSESISQAIVALTALEIDPTSKEFTKGEKNLLDCLLAYKTKDGGFAHTKNNLNVANRKATEQALQALAAYKNFKDGKIDSIYNIKEFKDDIKVEEIEIKNLTNVKEFKLGTDAKIIVQAINNGKEAKDAALIIGLFDKDGEFVNYVAAKQSIESGKTIELNGIIKLPKEGQYTVKAFVWDGLEDMNSLSNVIEIPVK